MVADGECAAPVRLLRLDAHRLTVSRRRTRLLTLGDGRKRVRLRLTVKRSNELNFIYRKAGALRHVQPLRTTPC